MTSTVSTETLSAFRNEPVADFSLDHNRRAADAALGEIRARFGAEYSLLIAGERVTTEAKL